LRQVEVSRGPMVTEPMLSEDVPHFSRLAGSVAPGMPSLTINVSVKSKSDILLRIGQGFNSASKRVTTSVILGSH
jgi:hypothetical protein